MCVLQHCFICRPSDSTVSEVAGIEPRNVATLALTARRSNHLVRSHPHMARSHPHLARSHPLLGWLSTRFMVRVEREVVLFLAFMVRAEEEGTGLSSIHCES